MKNQGQHAGFTLIEMLIVVMIIAIMVALIIPATNTFTQSYRMSNAKNLIRTSLAQAQAYASQSRRYAGIRFQYDGTGWENGKQYLVLIEKVPHGPEFASWPWAYRAVPNVQPVSLPSGIGVFSGVIDMLALVDRDDYLDDDYFTDPTRPHFCLSGATTFSIIFSPSGQLVTKPVEIHERDTTDKIFNRPEFISMVPPEALLSYDDYFGAVSPGMPWCVREDSATSFYLFEASRMKAAPEAERYTTYVNENTSEGVIRNLKPIMINVYTGKLMEEE